MKEVLTEAFSEEKAEAEKSLRLKCRKMQEELEREIQASFTSLEAKMKQ